MKNKKLRGLLSLLLQMAFLLGLLYVPAFAYDTAPTITTDVAKRYETVAANTIVTLSVIADGATSYQWQKKNPETNQYEDIEGANENHFSPNTATPGTRDYYQVLVSNNVGSKTSSMVTVTVLPDNLSGLSANFDFSEIEGKTVDYLSNHRIKVTTNGLPSGVMGNLTMYKVGATGTGGSKTFSDGTCEYYANTTEVGNQSFYYRADYTIDNTKYTFESAQLNYTVSNKQAAPNGWYTYSWSNNDKHTVAINASVINKKQDKSSVLFLLDGVSDNAEIELAFYNNITKYINGLNLPFITEQAYSTDDDCIAYVQNLLSGTTVKLENGAASLSYNLYYGTQQSNLKNYPLTINLTTDPDAFYTGDTITKVASNNGKWENEGNPVFLKKAYLITPYGTTTAAITLTFDTSVVSAVKIDNGDSINLSQKTYTANLSVSSDGIAHTIQPLTASGNEAGKPYTIWCVSQRYSGLPNAVTDYLCVASQYTNSLFHYGGRAQLSLVGSNAMANPGAPSGPVSLGNYGGYITYYYENAITDSVYNPYGIDFIVYGNSVDGGPGFAEPGQVWVSEDGKQWYALAGSLHYDDNTIWNYKIKYEKTSTGKTNWSDNYGHNGSLGYSFPNVNYYRWHTWTKQELMQGVSEISMRGLYLGAEQGVNEYGNTLPPFPHFGYADVGARGTVLPGEDLRNLDEDDENITDAVSNLLARNNAGNPYQGLSSSGRIVVTDGMDLAWAVDDDGKPVTFENGIHYVKIATASFIVNDAIGEKSTEINMVRVAQPAESDVGQTPAPTSLTIGGYHVEADATGKVYDVTVSAPFAVDVTAPADANVYINGERAASRKFDTIPTHGIIRVIVQEGEKAPWIGYLNLTEGAPEADAVTLYFVDADTTITGIYDASLNGYPLPERTATATNRHFVGWTYGQKTYTSYVHGELPDGATLTAVWQMDKTPSQNNITVSFRLIGSSKSKSDIDLADGDYRGAEYQTWIATSDYTLPEGSTAIDLMEAALARAGLETSNPGGNYIEGIYAPASLGGQEMREFTNGPRSGWMYTLNGVHANLGVAQQVVEDGDAVILHYVDDYAYEVADWDRLGGVGYPALGDSTYHNAWLAAPDLNPESPGYSGGVPSGDKKDDKKETSGSETTTDQNTVTADDGSIVSTETEKTVEVKENDDGSVTETVSENTKTTVTAPDGNVSTTETAVETATTTNSVKNTDGSVTDTTESVEKVTETVTAADGTKQTVVTEMEEAKNVTTTTGADGKVSGSGTYSAKTTVTAADGKKTTAVTEGTVAVSTDDAGTVSEVTTAKTTTTAPDGTKTETVTVITEATAADGCTGTVVADEAGNTLSAEASVSEAAQAAAEKSGAPIPVPVTVNPASAAVVRLHVPELAKGKRVWVEIGTTKTAPGNVAYLKLAEGITKLLTECRTGSVIVPVTGDCEVIIKDNSKTFSDVEAASWYSDSVAFVTAREIFNGTGNGIFAPGATMNRAMAAQILYNLDGEAKAGDGSRFSDVSAGDWFNGAVGWAAGLGVINGYDGTYAPLDAVTRQDLVTILYRYAKQAGFDVSAGSSVNLTAYADGAEVASYAAEAMRWAIAVGIIGGYEDNTLRPTATATRAEVAAIMQRMVQNTVK